MNTFATTSIPGHRIAIDIGGTFTDCVVVDEATGELSVVKRPSTPMDPSLGFVDVLSRATALDGVSPETVSLVMHATTVATNAILEGRLARSALVVTQGFADILEIATQVRPRLYDLEAMKPAPLVPREHVFEIDERIDADGGVVAAIDGAALCALVDRLAAIDVEAIVVCLLHSYVNPAHEHAIVAALQAAMPDRFVSASSSICPQMGEYARACTALVNAGLVPHVSDYFARVSEALAGLGIAGELQVMKSDGGLLPARLVTALPVEIIESGPAAGVIGVAELAGRLGLDKVVCFDMGGTTAKAGLLLDGKPILTPSFEVGHQAAANTGMARGGGYPIKAPMVDLVEVGAGGGSIAWIDSGGVLRVGPRSAGATPGPVCYAKGGTEPTVTDANVALGRISPDYFLGGAIPLDRAASWRAIEEKIARPLNLSVPQAALGILEVANATMLGALRRVSVQRGFDTAEFCLVCTGGAAGLQVDALFSELGVEAALMPPTPGVGTARGMLFADVRREFRSTCLVPLDAAHAVATQAVLGQLFDRARAAFAGFEHQDRLELVCAADVRFRGQSHQFRLDIPEAAINAASQAALATAFRGEHTRLYGFAPAHDPIEIVELLVTALWKLPKPQVAILPEGDGSAAQAIKGYRDVWLRADASDSTTIYERARLCSGDSFPGPAIIEAPDSTILIGLGHDASVDARGNVRIARTSGEHGWQSALGQDVPVPGSGIDPQRAGCPMADRRTTHA